ncbi:MAG TPA: hypothetical protein VHW66_15570 [Stellaceae bacterium]|jgi:hypothetical protein|nr:hypothetical protein [Stellaceae bacterium]
MSDLSHLPPASAAELRQRLNDAGIELSDDLFREFVAVWPGFEQMVRRIPRNFRYADDPAHIFPPMRITK